MSISPPTLTGFIDLFAFAVYPGLVAIFIAAVPVGALIRRCRAREVRMAVGHDDPRSDPIPWES